MGQSPDGPMKFSDLTKALANPDYVEVNELTELIKIRGIGFELSEQYLGLILSNSIKGGRDPDQVAALILASMQACQECRARAIAPMTKDGLKQLISWGFSPSAILEEARVRGVADIEVSAAAAAELRTFGARDDLINLLMPDDKMPTKAPEGDFKPIALRRAEGYTPTALKGWLKITTDFPARSQSEFVFKHNALFVRTTSGEDPIVDLDASSFNKPGPRNTSVELVDFQVTADNLDQKTGLFGGSAAIKPSAEYISADSDPDGRNAFRIHVGNKLNKPQRCVIYLEWTVRTTPKSPPPNTKP